MFVLAALNARLVVRRCVWYDFGWEREARALGSVKSDLNDLEFVCFTPKVPRSTPDHNSFFPPPRDDSDAYRSEE